VGYANGLILKPFTRKWRTVMMAEVDLSLTRIQWITYPKLSSLIKMQ